MFENLTEKFEGAFRRLRSRGKLYEADIDEALKEVRVALLEADVNLQVVKKLCDNVKKRSLGKELVKSVDPGQLVVKYVYDELVEALGKHEALNLRFAPPVIIMLVELQGSGKTTTCGKLARYLKYKIKRRPLLVPAEVYRTAAIEH